ncbi:MAG: Chromosome-partitioning protein ParB [Hyphomicrobiaceae bacterium hypho_1]
MAAIPVPNRGRLGKGLRSLIGENDAPQSNLPREGIQKIVPLDQLQASELNPRQEFREDDLIELADSIRQHGLIQPLIVRKYKNGGYEIVAGERRWRAAQKAGIHSIPVIIRYLSDQEVLEIAIIENVQRSDLNAIEEANGYSELIERFGYTQDKLSEVIGKSRSHLANTLRLLKLSPIVQNMIRKSQLTAGHARALIGRGDAEILAHQIIEKNLTVRDVEALVQRSELYKQQPSIRRSKEKNADLRFFEQKLTETLGLRVDIKRGGGESGMLAIKYANLEQLEYICERLCCINE